MLTHHHIILQTTYRRLRQRRRLHQKRLPLRRLLPRRYAKPIIYHEDICDTILLTAFHLTFNRLLQRKRPLPRRLPLRRLQPRRWRPPRSKSLFPLFWETQLNRIFLDPPNSSKNTLKKLVLQKKDQYQLTLACNSLDFNYFLESMPCVTSFALFSWGLSNNNMGNRETNFQRWTPFFHGSHHATFFNNYSCVFTCIYFPCKIIQSHRLTQIVTIIFTPQIFSCYARMTWRHEIERSTRVSQKIINRLRQKHQHNFKF